MKVKLLKKLRKKSKIIYYYHSKQYELIRINKYSLVFETLEEAKTYQFHDIRDYARYWYQKYSKKKYII